ncbi:hypothetical protein F5148DRAFT_1355950 [Russula earlei]|uniref:Uncharacterized protein n=1 Tax=Russula earlei TaxID=71964 RepID=A0ACC0U9S9_9AGAM|nr:hypothetical protein F5148DRAFT_1355950 [Russula earlei]
MPEKNLPRSMLTPTTGLGRNRPAAIGVNPHHWKGFADNARSTNLTETFDLGDLAFPYNNLVLVRELELDRGFERFKARLEQYLKSWHDNSPPARLTDADDPISFHFAHLRLLHGENPPELEKAIDDILNNAITYFGYIARDIFRAVFVDFQHVYNDNMAALNCLPEDLEAMLHTIVHSDVPSHSVIVIKSRHEVGLEVEQDIDFKSVRGVGIFACLLKAKRIYQRLDSIGVKWTSIPLAYANAREAKPFCSLILSIDVQPYTLV